MEHLVLSGNIVEHAARFHGHLGPFLVIGTKIGLLGLKKLNVKKTCKQLSITASLPLRVPYSCIIDGLQITTKCTIGNQRLSLRDSQEIRVKLERKDNGQKIVVVLRQPIIEKLESQLLHKRMPNEEIREIAWRVAAIPDDELFAVTV